MFGAGSYPIDTGLQNQANAEAQRTAAEMEKLHALNVQEAARRERQDFIDRAAMSYRGEPASLDHDKRACSALNWAESLWAERERRRLGK